MLKPTAMIAARMWMYLTMSRIKLEPLSLALSPMGRGNLHRGAPKRCPLAVRVFTPDLQLDMVAVDLRDPAAAAIGPAGNIDPSIADLEGLQRAAIAQPVRDQLPEEGGLQQPM